MVIFQISFVWKIYNEFTAFEPRQVSLNGNMYDFLLDYNSTDKSDILNIHKHLMHKNNIKQYLALLNKCSLYYLVLVSL